MAITYQSIQSNTAGSGTTIVVTKPTSLAVGDLMIAQSIYSSNQGITLPTGFTTVHSGTINALRSYITGYKIATAGDVAAANFTFTTGSTMGDGTAALLRFTTTSTFPTNPIILSANPTDGTTTSTPSFTLGINSGPSTTFFVANYFVNANSITSSAQASSPSRTWTERNDTISGAYSCSIATAPNTTPEALTTFSLTVSSTASSHTLSFLVIGETETVTSDISHLAITPSFEGITASQVNVATNISNLSTSPTITGVETSVTQPSVWTNTPKS